MSAIQDSLAATFASAKINPSRQREVSRVVDRIIAGRARYEGVEKTTGVPWWVIACIHNMEASLSFSKHLHNGDPLTARTRNVPANRPSVGKPPFSWEESAIDALRYDKLTDNSNWTIGVVLDLFERFNGLGYRKRKVASPYLWSFTNKYVKGKYTSDGIYSSTAVSQQVGIAAILIELANRKAVSFD